MICFLVPRILGSKAKEPTGDMAFMALLKMLVPLGGLGFLGYGAGCGATVTQLQQ